MTTEQYNERENILLVYLLDEKKLDISREIISK